MSFAQSQPSFAATRAEALAHWRGFLPRARDYARLRNHVLPGHPHVSRLSPAVRARLVSEKELLEGLLGAYPLEQVEKLAQEILWRCYWKSWLELRPGVWTDYRHRLERLRAEAGSGPLGRAAALERGESGVAVMDGFARELTATGYLHNHARMWFASFWVHVEGLPWELGADFFLRHLLDADPASNTLSWRWVAGLHTRGKSYLVRRSNLERYCARSLLADTAGLERLEDGRVEARTLTDTADTRLATPTTEPSVPGALPERFGLWLHEEDLSVEQSPLGLLRPVCVAAVRPVEKSPLRAAWLERALADALERARPAFRCPADLLEGADLAGTLGAWARAQGLRAVVARRPCVGPLADALAQVRLVLGQEGVTLLLLRREEDLAWLPLARRGFFDFWQRVRPSLASGLR